VLKWYIELTSAKLHIAAADRSDLEEPANPVGERGRSQGAYVGVWV
jgi:hypothetical protein